MWGCDGDGFDFLGSGWWCRIKKGVGSLVGVDLTCLTRSLVWCQSQRFLMNDDDRLSVGFDLR